MNLLEEILEYFMDSDLNKIEKIMPFRDEVYNVIAYRMNDPAGTIRIDLKKKAA